MPTKYAIQNGEKETEKRTVAGNTNNKIKNISCVKGRRRRPQPPTPKKVELAHSLGYHVVTLFTEEHAGSTESSRPRLSTL